MYSHFRLPNALHRTLVAPRGESMADIRVLELEGQVRDLQRRLEAMEHMFAEERRVNNIRDGTVNWLVRTVDRVQTLIRQLRNLFIPYVLED